MLKIFYQWEDYVNYTNGFIFVSKSQHIYYKNGVNFYIFKNINNKFEITCNSALLMLFPEFEKYFSGGFYKKFPILFDTCEQAKECLNVLFDEFNFKMIRKELDMFK